MTTRFLRACSAALLCSLTTLSLIIVNAASAQTMHFIPRPPLEGATRATQGDEAGRAVAIDGDTIVVGAPMLDFNGVDDRGAFYVYRRSGPNGDLSQEVGAVLSTTAADDHFGAAVAISHDCILVGAPGDDDAAGADQGSVYIFRRSGSVWVLEGILRPADAAPGDRFGYAVAIDHDTAIVSAYQDDGPAGENQGSVYVFTYNGATWTQQAKLLAADGAAFDEFGFSVAIDDDTAIVGAQLDGSGIGTQHGSAYIFQRIAGMWMQQAKLVASDAASQDRFGIAVSIDGDSAVVGAFRDDESGGVDQGSAYVFTRTGSIWSEQTKLLAVDGAAGDNFGRSVAISGDLVLVGSPLDDDPDLGADAGSAYMFGRTGNTWSPQRKVIAYAAGDQFGFSVSLSGDASAFGIPLNDGGGQDNGSFGFTNRTAVWVGPELKTKHVDTEFGGQYGFATAIDGDTAIVSALNVYNDSAGLYAAGAAYILTRTGSTWTQQEILRSGDGVDLGQFGYAVDVDGDTAVIGARAERRMFQEAAGFSWVSTRTGSSWSLPIPIGAPDFAAGDRFGSSVAIDGDTIVVGAPFRNSSAGAVYVYTRNGSLWPHQATIIASDPEAFAYFGNSVDIDGDTLVVGAPGSTNGAPPNRQGAAYVFTRAGGIWTQQDKLIADDAAHGDSFGWDCAISADLILIGAPDDDGTGQDSGSAYVFSRSGASWIQQDKLVAPNAEAFDHFGRAVAIEAGSAVVGATAASPGSTTMAGAAYVFTLISTTWLHQATLAPSDGVSGDVFGDAVAMSGDTIVVGAHLNDEGGASGVDAAGAAYFYEAAFTYLNDPTTTVRNITDAATELTLFDAANNASADDVLGAAYGAFATSSPLNLASPNLLVESSAEVHQDRGAVWLVGDGVTISAAPGRNTSLFGTIGVPAFATATIEGDQVVIGHGAILDLNQGSVLDFGQSDAARIEPDLTLFNMTVGGGALLELDGAMSLEDATLTAAQVIRNDSTITSAGTSALMGSVDNRGVIDIDGGHLMVADSLHTEGPIRTGFFAPTPGQGDLTIGADLTAGPRAAVQMDFGVLTVGRDFMLAIDAADRFDLINGELYLDGVFGEQFLEVMSTDIGPSFDGLLPGLQGSFPIGTLRIGPTIINVADDIDNDTLGGFPEALYVRELIVEPGATINTNGHRIYYQFWNGAGAIDDPANLIRLGCAADLNLDNLIDGADLGLLLGAWGAPDGDLNGDGNTDGADLGLLLGAWGACP